MSRLTDRLERDLQEVAAGAQPSPSAWESIVARLDDDAASEAPLVLVPSPDRAKRSVWPAVVAAAFLVIVGSIAVFTSLGDDQQVSTTDPDATVADFPELTSTYVSRRNGFSVDYFDRGEGTLTPASQLWGFSDGVDGEFDVVETGLAAVFKGASTSLTGRPPGLPMEEYIDGFLTDDSGEIGACGVPRSRQAEIVIDGQPGTIAECPNHIEATVVVDQRLYLFTLAHDRRDARAVFDAFAATIDLTPETAVDFPAMTTTFVSPTYGYSFRYHDRGGLEPATEVWDPDTQPVEDLNFDPRFDGVESGLAAYFEAASTPIPDGVSVDDWVDAYVTPLAAGGCGVPRSRQEEITIDGQSARVSECRHLEATVVAGGRLYLFTLGHERSDARAWFDAWIATIDLTPETAMVP